MREHRFSQRRLSDYVDGELHGRTRGRVSRHAAACPECGPLLRGLIQVRAVLGSIGRAPHDRPSVVPIVLTRIRSDHESVGAGLDETQ